MQAAVAVCESEDYRYGLTRLLEPPLRSFASPRHPHSLRTKLGLVGWVCLGWLPQAFGCWGQPSCPRDMVMLEAGTFTLGTDHPRPYEQEVYERLLPAFCMDRYEYPNVEGSLPTVLVSWQESVALCEAQGKRLCSSDEWERACRGTSAQRWSYGTECDSEACNTPWEIFQEPPPPYAKSGSHSRCRNAEGVMDLNGNVSEWVQDVWKGPRADFDARDFSSDTTFRTVRGGTMWNHTFYGQDCLSAHGHPETVRHIDDGLRCCMGVE